MNDDLVRGLLVSAAAWLVCASALSAQVTLAPAVNYPAGTDAHTVRHGDFNGDGDEDIVSSSTGSLSLFVGNGNGTLAPRVSLPAGAAITSFQVADLDGDGDLDLVVGNGNPAQSPGFSVLINDGSGAFGAPTYVPGSPVLSLDTGDLDGDGDVDLAATFAITGGYGLFLNDGSGGFSAGSTGTLGGDITIFCRDFDSDGDLDLASPSSSGYVYISLNDGSGSFSAQAGYPVGLSWGNNSERLGFGDVDADGDLDVVLAHAGSSSATIFVALGNGNGSLAAAQPYSTYPHYTFGFVVEDLNGDGLPEIVSPDYQTNDVLVLTNLGAGSFGSQSLFPVGTYPRGITACDLDANGVEDVVTGNLNSFDISVLINQTSGGPASHPGTGEDFVLNTWVNGLGIPLASTKSAQPGDLLTVKFFSPAGTFIGDVPMLLGQLYATTTPPPPALLAPLGVHIDLVQALFLFNGSGSPLGPLPLQPGGLSLTYQLSPVLTGLTVRLQAGVFSLAAANGSFATTDAHDVDIQ